MNIETRGSAMVMLAFKYEAAGKPFTSTLEDGFDRILAPLADAEGLAAVEYAVATCKFLNEMISTILHRHAELIANLPALDSAWLEVSDKMGRPGRQRLSHPLIAAATFDVGGLDGLWHEYDRRHISLTTLRDRFADAYNARLENHLMQVIQAVSQEGSVEAARLTQPKLFCTVQPTLRLAAAPLPEIAPMRPDADDTSQRSHDKEKVIAAQTLARLREQLGKDVGSIGKSMPTGTAQANGSAAAKGSS